MKADRQNEQDSFDIKKNRPQAGEERSFATGESLFLSPLPVPTGQAPMDLGGSFLAVNDTFLDVGSGNFNKAFQVQVVINTIMFGLFVCLIFLPILVGVSSLGDVSGRTFLDNFLEMLNGGAVVGAIGIAFGGFCGGYAILSSTFTKARSRPLRFNRQRREVCYFPDGSDEPVIQPWEDTVAWVSVSTGTNGIGLMSSYTFGMAIDDPKADKVHFLTHGVMTPFHAMGKWEAIRTYMEKGPEYCPGVAPHEGRHTFDEQREDLWEAYREGDAGWLGVGCWYLWRIITWWRIPYWIAEWDHRYAMKAMPDTIAEWSRPLPPEQWAKPSEALRKQSAELEKAFAEGVDLIAYFKAQSKALSSEVQ